MISIEIKKNYLKLRKSEQKVADYMLENTFEMEGLTIAVLAQKVGVSQPTIMRMLSAIGYSSFRRAKLAFLEERLQKESKAAKQGVFGIPIHETDQVSDVPTKVIMNTIQLLEDSLKTISPDSLEKAIEAITKANQVVIYAVENSSTTANDLMTKLLYLGIPCNFYEDYYLQSVSANNLKKGDVAIAISYTGCSKHTVDVLKLAKKAGATTIAITNFYETPLVNHADIVIMTSSNQFLYGSAIYSRTTHIALVDMIYMGILISDYHKYTNKMDESSNVIWERAYRNDNK